MRFEFGDRVYHRNLKLYGTFLDYALESDDECDVAFEIENKEIVHRHVSVSCLVRAIEVKSEPAKERRTSGRILYKDDAGWRLI